MGQTSRKLYNAKNSALSSSANKIDVSSNEELLLLSAPSEFDKMYKTLRVRSKQDFVAKQLRDSNEIKAFQKKYDNLEAFKGEYIKEICNKYDLMVLPISEVKGYLSDNAMKSIKEFGDKFDKTVISDTYFYILAKRECFYNTFEGREVKTYIVFYKSHSSEKGDGYRRIRERDIVNQVCSSGTDFSMFRVFNQLFLTKVYRCDDDGDAYKITRLAGNIMISTLLVFSIILSYNNSIISASIVFLIYLLIMAVFNTSEEYKSCWNKYSSNHRGYE